VGARGRAVRVCEGAGLGVAEPRVEGPARGARALKAGAVLWRAPAAAPPPRLNRLPRLSNPRPPPCRAHLLLVRLLRLLRQRSGGAVRAPCARAGSGLGRGAVERRERSIGKGA
jgi:hypothetical protein